MDTVLQLLGLVGLVTLGVICVTLSLDKSNHLVVVSGQTVFRWLSVTIVVLALTRVALFFSLIDGPTARTANSLVFLVSVIGITWSVARHAKRTY